jgi:hypothetical protein
MPLVWARGLERVAEMPSSRLGAHSGVQLNPVDECRRHEHVNCNDMLRSSNPYQAVSVASIRFQHANYVSVTELPHGKGKAETVPVDLAKPHGQL